MNSDATQNRQRNSRTVLLIQEQPLLWEVAFFSGQQGSGLTSQDKGRSCVQASHGCHYCICSKRNNDFSGSSPPTLLHHNPCLPKSWSFLGAQRLHYQSRNVLTDRSFCEPSGSGFPPGCNHHCLDAPGDTQALERRFPVLCVPPHWVEAATMCLLSDTSSLTKFFQSSSTLQYFVQRPKTSPEVLLDGEEGGNH